jgi:hypothetical protein
VRTRNDEPDRNFLLDTHLSRLKRYHRCAQALSFTNKPICDQFRPIPWLVVICCYVACFEKRCSKKKQDDLGVLQSGAASGTHGHVPQFATVLHSRLTRSKHRTYCFTIPACGPTMACQLIAICIVYLELLLIQIQLRHGRCKSE